MIPAGTLMTCTNDDCSCRLQVVEPCPHGDDFRCGCGHPFTTTDAAGTSDTPVTPGA
jgi:hypothetical protein